MTLRFRVTLGAALAVIWGAAVAGGFAVLHRHDTRPGTAGEVPTAWPASCGIRPASALPTLLVFAHPHCPCTRATLGELARVMAKCQGALEARILFYLPADQPESWGQSDTWLTAQGIPGVQVAFDPDGSLAARFAVETSGHAILCDPDGRRLFSGGITPSRGHAGDSAGQEVLVSLVRGQTVRADGAPVFGCPLRQDPPVNR